VAAEEGQITSIGRYTVSLLGTSGTLYRYLHMNMQQLAITEGQQVKSGQRMGLVSNFFGATPTTIHLHFEMKQYVQDQHGNRAFTFVPPYSSLVRSYANLLSNLEAIPITIEAEHK
jgi:murein DD-endopeptidase MepM/ murein hydrolase activator NlpD